MLNQNLLLAGDDAYNLTRSLRFRRSASGYLNRTPASAGNRKTWTWSAWVKLGSLDVTRQIFGTGAGATHAALVFEAGNTLFAFSADAGQTFLRTSQVFRDPSAWYHVVWAEDTTQATASNRSKLYVNGVQITAFSTSNYPSQNFDGNINNNVQHFISSYDGSTWLYDGYMTEVNFIDGQALTPSSFGETSTSTGVWIPKKYTGTYGTNGFYLKFTDNSSLSALGTDSSGNGNTWTVNNFSVTSTSSSYDSMKDVPTLTDADTANYWTLNPLNTGQLGTVQSGNLEWIGGDQNNFRTVAAQILPTTGKFYWEVTPIGGGSGGAFVSGIYIGIMNYANGGTGLFASGARIADTGKDDYVYYSDGRKVNLNSFVSYGNSYAANDVIGIAVDIDNGKIWYSKNGTWQASGDPAAGTNAAYTTVPFSTKTYAPAMSAAEITNAQKFNFGQRPFAYTPPTGFVALNTFNLPTPTIGATASSQADDYFNVLTWTGDGTTSRSLTGLSFQPDFVWIKQRSTSISHTLYNSIVGGGANKSLASNNTDSESLTNANSVYGYLNTFDSNGFSVVRGSDGSISYTNVNSGTYVAWNWKANGTGVTNTAGSITSTVSANTTAGFSIATFTIQSSGNATVGHGLGIAPSMIIIKSRSDVFQWNVYHASLGNNSYLVLNTTAAEVPGSTTLWNSTSPTSTVFSLGTAWPTYLASATAVAYCFAQVAGYSAFGSYTGNGSSDGPFVFTGFRPSFILVKRTDSTDNWVTFDNKRDLYNVSSNVLLPNLSNAESSSPSSASMDFVSNGFKIRASTGINSGTWIYMAFAENPFKYSLAR